MLVRIIRDRRKAWTWDARRQLSETRRSGGKPAALAYEYIQSDDNGNGNGNGNGEEKKLAVVCHGIMGNHKNLRQISTKFANAFPNYEMLLVTHRAHGKSERGEAPHNLEACANDLLELIRSEGKQPDMLIGHSFGGKVSLSVLKHLHDLHLEQDTRPDQDPILPPRMTWILDCPPGLWNKDIAADTNPLSQSVEAVMSTLKELDEPFESKKHLIKVLTDYGYSTMLAQWMSLNLERKPERGKGFYFSFDLQILQNLFESHKKTDLWPVLESEWIAQEDCRVHFVQATENNAWTSEITDRFVKVNEANPNIQLTPFDAGHWLHVQKPQELFDLMAPSFVS